MQYPDYDATADIEVINNNIKKLVQNAEEQDTQIKSKEPIINKKTGFNLDKTDLTENDSNKLFSAKGALNLFNTLTTNFTNGINAAKEVLRLDIAKKLDKGTYSGKAEDLKTDIDTKEPKFIKNSGFNKVKTDLVENDTNKVFSAKGAFDLKTWLVTNYTTLMNNIRDNLTNLINGKLNHGGYGGSGQQLKNDIDTKVFKSGDTMTGGLSILNQAGVAVVSSDGGSVALNYNNGVARIRYGGSGPILNGGLEIVGGSDIVKVKITDAGEILAKGTCKVYHPENKPSKSDVGLSEVGNYSSVNKKGDSMTGILELPGIKLNKVIKVGALINSTIMPELADFIGINTELGGAYITYRDGSNGTYGFRTGKEGSKASVIVGGTSFDLYHTGNKPSPIAIGAMDASDFYTLESAGAGVSTLVEFFRIKSRTFNGLYTTRRQHTDIPSAYGIDDRVEVKILGNHGGYGKTILLNAGAIAFIGFQWNTESAFTFKRIDETISNSLGNDTGVWKDPISKTMICWGTITSYTEDQVIAFPATFNGKPAVANTTQTVDTTYTTSVVMHDITASNFKIRCRSGGNSYLRNFSYIAIGGVI